MTPIHLKKNDIKKAYIEPPKISITSFYTKKIIKLKKTLRNFFAYPLFQILKKPYLQILKNLAQFFPLSPFSNIKKSIFTNLKKPNTVFTLFSFFKY